MDKSRFCVPVRPLNAGGQHQLGGTVRLRRTGGCFPVRVAGKQQDFHLLKGSAAGKVVVIRTGENVLAGVYIGMSAKAAVLIAKRLLVMAVGARNEVTAGTLLGRIGRIDLDKWQAAFRSTPGELTREMTELRGFEAGVHAAGFETQSTDREIFHHNGIVRMRLEERIDCLVDVLLDVAGQALRAST